MLIPTYRPTGSALHSARAGLSILYVAALCLVVALFDHPVVLAFTLAAIVAAGSAAGVQRELWRAARLALPLALLVTLINPLVSREGLTVVLQGPVVPLLGALDITAEALVYGCVAGLRVLVVVLTFALYSAAVHPDEVLRLFRRFSFGSALTASLATRLVPVIGRDAGRLSDAYALRADRPHAGSRLGSLRRGAVLSRALAAGALERSVDLAASLEVRGYAGGQRLRARRARLPWSRDDRAVAAAAFAIAALAVGGRIAGAGSFDAYPSLAVALAPFDVALGPLIATAALAPFVPGLVARLRRAGREGEVTR